MSESPSQPAADRRCPACNSVIPPDAPEGLCPSCLAARGLLPPPSPTKNGGGSFIPPGAEELNRIISGYNVLELIGHGGMGAVYKARQHHLDRIVALKLLPLETTESNPAFAERFKREARAMASLSHPNIVTVHDFGESTEGHLFLVMEYIEGTNLQNIIRAGKITPAEALAIIPQVCDGLQYAHSHGIIHRDIKPANILIDKSGTVKLTDFGLAKILGDKQPSHYTLTLEGHTMGTAYYMAPEQARESANVDHRADIYSLGVVFYELLTGQIPKGVFEPPSKKVEIDVRLDKVVLHALESEPERRYQQVSEVKTDVEEIRSHPTTHEPDQQTESDHPETAAQAVSTSRPGIAAAILLLAIFAGFGLWKWAPWKEKIPTTSAAGAAPAVGGWQAVMNQAGAAYDTNRFDEALRLYQEVDTLLKETAGMDTAVLAAARSRVAERLELQ